MFNSMSPKTKKILIIVGVILIIGLAVYFFRKGRKDKKDALAEKLSKQPNSSTPKTEQELIEEVEKDDVFPLKVGKEGKRVKQLQKYLIDEHGSDTLKEFGADGKFYHETLAAVQKHLKRDNVSKDLFLKKKMYNY